jgi:hypothetical protein
MPPGYSSSIDGEEAIMELKRAVYGLKQASASFFTAMDSHLKSKGFVPTLGDPCLYRRVGADGKIIIATYGVASTGKIILNIKPVKESTDTISTRIVFENIEIKSRLSFILCIVVSSPLSFFTIIFIPPVCIFMLFMLCIVVLCNSKYTRYII